MGLFLKNGFAATTTDAVAAHCQISKTTLYRLFPSKTALFAGIVIAHRQTMLALPRALDDMPLAQTISEIFMVDISEEEDQQRQLFIQLMLHEAGHFPEMAELLAEHGIAASRRDLAEWLGEQRAHGRIQLDDLDSGARMLMDLIFGAIAPKIDVIGPWPSDAAKRTHIAACIEVFLNGVCPRK